MPLVLDVVDDAPIFRNMRWARQRIYSAERYEVQVLPHDSAESAWFA